jgi:hypothetical protein
MTFVTTGTPLQGRDDENTKVIVLIFIFRSQLSNFLTKRSITVHLLLF